MIYKLAQEDTLMVDRFVNFVYVFVAGLMFGSLCAAQDIQITGGDVKVIEVDRIIVVKDKVQLVSSFPFTLSAPTGGLLYSWDFPQGVIAKRKANKLEVSSAPKGTITINAEWPVVSIVDGKINTEIKTASLTFAVGEPGPGPDPGPKPPDPQPAPIAADGFRVLVVLEKDDRPIYPASQVAALTSLEFEAYLNSKCAKEDGTGWASWRVWDQHQDTTNAPKYWQEAIKRKRDTLPWIVISNRPHGGYEGPLPKTLPEILKLLKQHGGE